MLSIDLDGRDYLCGLCPGVDILEGAEGDNRMMELPISTDILPRELYIYLAGLITSPILWLFGIAVKGFFGKVRKWVKD